MAIKINGIPVAGKGAKGDKGDKGADGRNGIDGANGKSAYEYAVDGGFTGTEEEFTEVIAKTTNLKRHVVGSYVGDGTYGASNPTILTFDFVPSAIIFVDAIYPNGNHLFQSNAGWVHTLSCAALTETYVQTSFSAANNYNYVRKTNGGKRIMFYSNGDYGAHYQFNDEGYTYYYIAFE